MRRKDREITDFDQIISIMKQCRVCHVAFHGDEYPYTVPMNFGMTVEDNANVTLYFHGADTGKKHDLIKKNNKVSFEMVNAHSIVTGPQVGACEATMEFESIMGTGIICYAKEEEKLTGLHAILEHYGVKEGPDYHFHHEVVPATTVLVLKVRDITAKRRKVGMP